MKLSTRGRYGLKAMFDLAMNYGKGPISLNSIAERQGVSLNYLEQLISPLRKAGYVKSVRGAQGGYMLAVDPEAISVGHILTTLEGPLAPTDCILHEDEEQCGNSEFCVSKLIYEEIYASLNEVVYGISLSHMIEQHDRLTQSANVDISFECK